MQFALFEDTLNPQQSTSYLFTNPVAEILVTDYANLAQALAKIETLRSQGYYLAGYLAYDAATTHLIAASSPLLHFIAYTNAQQFASQDLIEQLNHAQINLDLSTNYQFTQIQLQTNYQTYLQQFTNVQQHLVAGNTYQLNLTTLVTLEGATNNHAALYYQLSRSHPVAYAAYLAYAPLGIISISPELFFKKTAQTIYVRPMKGTAKRGQNPTEDLTNSHELSNDPKNRAENLIIVDLLRNDLAKIAQTNSVQVTDLFKVEQYTSLFQMTSSIRAQLDGNTTFSSIIEALFPCGSISGAPKCRTLELIAAIENTPRGIYTGAVGYILPNNDMQFNVAIRSLSYKNATPNQFIAGVGGGITVLSNVKDEWQEIQTKLKFLTKIYQPDFNLIESFACYNNKFTNLKAHLTRLINSAKVLCFNYDIGQILQQLRQLITLLKTNNTYKIRLELMVNGECNISYHEIQASSKVLNIALATTPINSRHYLFQHKTTSRLTRGLYTQLNQHKPAKIDELIFINQNGYITEAQFYNLIIEYENKWLTPCVTDGLLAGVFRNKLIQQNKLTEAKITTTMLKQASKIYLCNDVRGLIACKLAEGLC